MPASPLVEVRHGANPFVPLPYGTPFSATAGTPLNIRLVDTAGVTTWDLACVGSDETSTLLTVTRDAPPAMSATVTPQSGSGRSYVFRSRVNGGRAANGQIDPDLTYTFIVHVLATNSAAVVALNETFESSALHGWTAKVNAAIRAAGLAAMPSGTGVVVASDGVGATVPYGSYGTFCRIDPNTGVLTFDDPTSSTGGIEMAGGYLRVRIPSGTSGLGRNASGIFVQTAAASGTSVSSGIVTVVPSPNKGIEILSDGVAAKVDTTTMQLGAAGIGADASKVAVLSSGTITAANSRGKVQVAANHAEATGALAISSGTPAGVLVVSLTGLLVGDEIVASGTIAARDGTASASDSARLQITNNATAGAGTVYSTLDATLAYNATIPARYVVTVAGTHYVHLLAARASTNYNVTQRRLVAQAFRT